MPDDPVPVPVRLPDEVPETLRVLTREQYRQWLDDGYIVIEGAVPRETAEAVADDVWDFTGRDPDDTSTWVAPDQGSAGMVELHARPSVWRARTAEHLYGAFADLWGWRELRTSVNRANFNPPVTADWQREGFIHWDLDVSHALFNPSIQGVLAISDAGPDDGTFQCVPGSHRPILDWHARGRKGPCPTQAECQAGRDAVRVPLQAGDQVCWSMALLHGNDVNRGTRPRLALYTHLEPAGSIRDNHIGLQREALSHRLDVIDCWRYGGWQQALAEAVGCTEAAIHHWSRRCRKEGRGAALPPATRSARLSEQDRERVNVDLPRVATPRARDYLGDGAGRSSSDHLQDFLFCRLVCTCIQSVCGVEIEPVAPAGLDELGRRLIGVQPW